jgi:hypothetical protein
MTRCLALIAGAVLGLATLQGADAQTAESLEGGAGVRPAVFNPFASFSLNRFRFNTLGFLEVAPSAPTTQSSNAGGGGEIPAAAAIRPPYRPPVRSPYRPPPRPPF